MTDSAADWPTANLAATGPRKPRAPLLVTAELPPDVLAWCDALRRAHYPPERNRLRAHVTLFHALPHSVEDELAAVLGDLARSAPPPARIEGLMKLGAGTALAVESPEMVALHAVVADRMHGLLTQQDAQPLRLHVTIQNKVTTQAARALQAELGPQLQPLSFRFRGFGLYAWEDGLWRLIHLFSFRG
ncbi:2'-5' RNA ligase family protein [Novosphingobium panipatense]|uniref:2'-5' RNA ligase superfamily protein n=1 Tax=Novosphingobium panipatense TaxID=428991 RepID=A0ABY1Q204_9SPHN|nr:2'-5' RNA ligase family protein [Novosphingobium panipatense]SMP54097.1 2'-5' RNA ligase superfamily protein [Novosphingobium panipatense]